MRLNKTATIKLILGLLMMLLGSKFVSGDIVVDFNGLSEITSLPYQSPTSPAIDVGIYFSSQATVQLDNVNHGGVGSDYELRIHRGAGFWAIINFKLSGGGLFDFTSFNHEARVNNNSLDLKMQAVRSGVIVDEYEFTALGVHDLSNDTGFQGIDEARLWVASDMNQILFDDFRFNGVATPEPSSFMLMAMAHVLICSVRRRRAI